LVRNKEEKKGMKGKENKKREFMIYFLGWLKRRWTGYAVHVGEMENVHKILVRKPEGKRPLGRPRLRWD
jgi:hypothetical protein